MKRSYDGDYSFWATNLVKKLPEPFPAHMTHSSLNVRSVLMLFRSPSLHMTLSSLNVRSVLMLFRSPSPHMTLNSLNVRSVLMLLRSPSTAYDTQFSNSLLHLMCFSEHAICKRVQVSRYAATAVETRKTLESIF